MSINALHIMREKVSVGPETTTQDAEREQRTSPLPPGERFG